jgi:hypothetical protein
MIVITSLAIWYVTGWLFIYWLIFRGQLVTRRDILIGSAVALFGPFLMCIIAIAICLKNKHRISAWLDQPVFKIKVSVDRSQKSKVET